MQSRVVRCVEPAAAGGQIRAPSSGYEGRADNQQAAAQNQRVREALFNNCTLHLFEQEKPAGE